MFSFEEIIEAAKRICWYPSASMDTAPAYFINTFSADEEADLFIFTDYSYRDPYCQPTEASIERYTLDHPDLLRESLKITGLHVGWLCQLNSFDFGAAITENGQIHGDESPIYYGELRIFGDSHPEKLLKILFIGSYNEPFCNNFLVENKIPIRYLIFKRPQTMNSIMSGLWIYNMIILLQVKFLATDIEGNSWNDYDDQVINLYPKLGPRTVAATYSREESSVILHLHGRRLAMRAKATIQLFDPLGCNEETRSAYFRINEVPEL
jgi:hypothetical protein